MTDPVTAALLEEEEAAAVSLARSLRQRAAIADMRSALADLEPGAAAAAASALKELARRGYAAADGVLDELRERQATDPDWTPHLEERLRRRAAATGKDPSAS